MTMFYGAVGYGAATTLGLKALIAAILGGIGSISGAFLGGLLVGAFEARWSRRSPIDYRDVAVFSLLAIVLVCGRGASRACGEVARRAADRRADAGREWRFSRRSHILRAGGLRAPRRPDVEVFVAELSRVDAAPHSSDALRRRAHAADLRVLHRSLPRVVLAAALWSRAARADARPVLFLLPPMFPLVAFFYNGLTVSGYRMATPGMRMMDLQMRMYDNGGRVPFINAAVAAAVLLPELDAAADIPRLAGRRRETLPARHTGRRGFVRRF